MDKNGKLSESDKQKIKEWMREQWDRVSNPNCPLCQKNLWTIGDHAVSPLSTSQEGSTFVVGPSYPQVMLVCTHCGNTLYFNAVIMGLVKAKKSEEKDGDKSDPEQ